MIRKQRKRNVALVSGALVAATAVVPWAVLGTGDRTADGRRVAATAPQDTAQARAEIKAALEGMVRDRAATAAMIRVGGGRSGWTAGAGVADLASRRPADPAGHFRIGSVTKTFVATVLLQLRDEGRLGLDDPVERHLPGVVPGGAHVTVRQILDHTSGLRDYMSEPGYSTNRWRGEERFRSYSPEQLLKVAFAKPPHFEPGTSWRYSNTNYVVAGLLVEKLTGRPYGREIERRILRPLRMTQTVVPGNRPGLPRPHARGYEPLPTGEIVDATRMNPSLDWAAGEMISTTRDLDRFLDGLLTRRLTSGDSLAAMRAARRTDAGFAYGLGLQKYTLPCGRAIWGHSGELIGYLTFAFRSDDGRRMTLSVNPHTRNPGQNEVYGIATKVFCP
ncbi:serine hydrolase domain-containing protein [Actinomadura namibiensis]|uniref:D-alanyl-D-alanine carboxypeptidase n=1 Tax=Actinomadura namibiensis TaxID=182080 RepID=A0A7W3LIJ8_ACTNM|nr:serine hydrolase domain-containing protein [Actinomadura namibiensis]MBA8948814.1 D-alanyl-D-alanine carboxypeptidase [Actinomadura namibiensis]